MILSRPHPKTKERNCRSDKHIFKNKIIILTHENKKKDKTTDDDEVYPQMICFCKYYFIVYTCIS